MSLEFDILNNRPCLLPEQETETCTPLEAGDVTLELRPAVATVAIDGTVQYQTFVVANGVEKQVTTGLIYGSSEQGIALIGAIGGNATGLKVGIATISVTWQGLKAYAQIQVVGSCATQINGSLILVDRSKSMTQDFGAPYGSKLDFAKILGRLWIDETPAKDYMAIEEFSAEALVSVEMTTDKVVLTDALNAITSDNGKTDFWKAFKAATDYLASVTTVDKKIIVLLTDGYRTDGDSPVELANAFKQTGGVLVVVALRAGVGAFQLLEQMASPGYFISAYNEATAEEGKDYLSGVKGYLCAGNCCEAGTFPRGDLDYASFYNWDVTGVVDLIGEGLFDLLPGHGFYVDLCGSSSGSGIPFIGKITTKSAYTLVNGRSYKLSYKLAGNQREDRSGDIVTIKVGTLLNKDRQFNDYTQDFTSYEDTITGDGGSHKISVEQKSRGILPNGLEGTKFYGNLLDDVKLLDTVTGEILIFDSFDQENLQTVTCPTLGYGCLDAPVKAQKPDPNPVQDSELDVPPRTYTSTQCYTATCPAPSEAWAPVTRCVTYVSTISAEDAQVCALRLAQEEAEAALLCAESLFVGDIINIDAKMTGSSTKKGQAAIGLTAEDVWNQYNSSSPIQNLKKTTGKLTLASLRVENSVGNFEMYNNNNPDPMMKKGLHGQGTDKISNLPAGYYDIYVYGHGGAGAPSAPTLDHFERGIWKLTVGATNHGTYGTTEVDDGKYETAIWQEGIQYVRWTNIQLTAGQEISIERFPNTFGRHLIMGIQIKRTA